MHVGFILLNVSSSFVLLYQNLFFFLFECRFAKYYKTENGTEFRTLHKAYAIRFDVMVTGHVSCVETMYASMCVFVYI